MKSFVATLCVIVLLCGCGKKEDGMKAALSFRDRLLNASECGFTAEVIADYGDVLHSFTLKTKTNSQGVLSFTVDSPETIRGISGSVGQSGSALLFEDKVLAFPMLADGQLAPVAAPWIFVQALRSGYISSVSEEEEHWRLSLLDSHEGEPLTLDVWFDTQWIPVQCRIYYKGEDILALQLEDFQIL